MLRENLHELAAKIRGHDLGTSPASNTAWTATGVSSPLGRAMDRMLNRMQYIATLLEDEAEPGFSYRHKPVPTAAAIRMTELTPPAGADRQRKRLLTLGSYDALHGYLTERSDLMARALGAVPGHAGRFVRKEAGSVARTTATALRTLEGMGRPVPDAMARLHRLAGNPDAGPHPA